MTDKTLTISRLAVRIGYSLFLVGMAVATFVEWRMGSDFTHRYFYGSVWFAVAIGLLTLGALPIVITALRKRKAALLLHLAFALIVVGALTTRLFGVQGQMHLRVGSEPTAFFVDSENQRHTLPFALELRRFEVVNYPATDTPLDYRSVIADAKGVEYQVSMNRVLSIDGFRFYQSGYDPDERGTFLSVNHDPFGIGLSYAGYALMALAFILLIFNRKGTYAKLLRRLSTPTCIALLVLTSACSQPSQTPLTASRQQLSLISDSVLIFYNGRIAPLSTYATDFTLKIAGSRTWRGLSAEQVLIGWLCFPDRWQDEKMLKIKGDLPENAGVDADGNRCSILDLFEDDGRYKLEKFFGPKTPKAVSELNDRAQLIVMLTSGEEVRLFPWRDAAENVRWLSPSDRLPREMSEQQRTFVRNFVSILRTAIENDDAELIGKLTSSLATMQRRALADHAPSAWRLSLENAVNAIAPTTWLARLTLTLGLAMLILWLWKNDLFNRRKVRLAAVAVLATFGILQLANLIARGLIAMQLPLATGYETMLVLALGITVVAFAARRVAFAIVPTSLLLTGFALLVADLGLNNPSITPLMPVLHSPWLSIHVATVMMSYSLLTLTALNSLAALAMRRNTQRSVDLGLALLYPAVALLSVGIFVGAVWANESWGNYWSWDPKEVWALITLLVYIVPLHANLIPTLKTPRNFHIFTALAFLTVLMTYFGVNHLLGGMHSYGAQ